MSREKRLNLTLRDILEYYSTEPLPDTWVQKYDDILPNTIYKVMLAFMSEDETHITAYAEHPLLIPWYDCPVSNIDVVDENTLRIWLAFEGWWPNKIHEWQHPKDCGWVSAKELPPTDGNDEAIFLLVLMRRYSRPLEKEEPYYESYVGYYLEDECNWYTCTHGSYKMVEEPDEIIAWRCLPRAAEEVEDASCDG
jgi:hypothetical protein